MYGINKYMIDINIETLAGTTFSLKVSPLESIQSLKAKIQRHEGIPISHQHLVWKSNELEDNRCLNDYNVPNGATIRMVLALRGGPINTRRMTTEDTLLRDVSDLMEEIQEESNLWTNNDSSHSINKHVTLLLFRDGDHLNLLRVIDRGDVTSPVSGAMSAASMYVPFDETDPDSVAPNNYDDVNNKLDIDLSKSSKIEKLITKASSYQKSLASNENQKTKAKMNAIKQKIKLNRKEKILRAKLNSLDKTTPTSSNTLDNKPSDKNETDNQSNKTVANQSLREENEEENENQNDPKLTNPSKPLEPVPPSTKPNSNEKLENLNNIRLKRYQSKVEEKMETAKETMAPKITTTNENCTKEGQSNSDEENCYNNEYLAGDDFEDGYDDDEEDDDEDDEGDEEYDEEDEDEDDQYAEEDEYDDEDDDNENEYDEEDEEDEDEEDEEVESGHVSTNEAALRHVNKILKNHNYYNKKYSSQDNDQEPGNEDDENYEDEDNELLLNKSEFLLNENNQNNNSPNNASSDLMAIMMMTLNGDHLSIGGASSSLATTALPTIITPFYVTDNENFNYAHNQKSPSNKIKNFRGMNSKKYMIKNQKLKVKQSNKNKESDNKDENSLVSQNEAVNACDESLSVSQNQIRRRRRIMTNSDSPKLPLKSDLVLTQDSTFSKENTDDSELATNPISKENTQNTIEMSSCSPTKMNVKRKMPKASTRKRNRQIPNKIRLNQISQNECQTQIAQNELNETTENSISKNEVSGHDSANKSTQVELPFDSDKQKRITKMLQSTINLYNHFSTSVEANNPNKEKSWGSQLVLSIPADTIDATKLKTTQKVLTTPLDKTDTHPNENIQSANVDVGDLQNSNVETNNESSTENNLNQNTRYKGTPSALSRMFSANQKRVSFIVSLNESSNEKGNDESNKTDSNTNAEIINQSFEREKSSANSASNGAAVQVKPIVMSGFKQKHFSKLDSIYTASQDVTSNEAIVHRQKNHQLDSLQLDNKSKSSSYESYNNEPQLSSSKNFHNTESINNNYEAKKIPSYLQPSLLSKRHIQTHFTPSATVPHVLNSTSNSIINKHEVIPTSSILKSYQQQPSNNQNSKYDINVNNSSSKIEISRIYSASNKMNKPFSMSTNDLTQSNTKGLKLPPVNNLKVVSSNNDTIMIGGSTNNINSISINESLGKKKITDLSRYCYFCQRKTGLASSYICRCGNNYCTNHRNAEAHNCTFDYKTEGRKLIEHSNPLVAAPKLPKI